MRWGSEEAGAARLEAGKEAGPHWAEVATTDTDEDTGEPSNHHQMAATTPALSPSPLTPGLVQPEGAPAEHSAPRALGEGWMDVRQAGPGAAEGLR